VKLSTYLEDCAARYPDKLAYICGKERVSFSELAQRARRLGAALLDGGVSPGDRVALFLPNGAAVVDAMAAIGAIGAVMVPISTRLGAQEVAYILEDSDASQIIFDSALREVVEQVHTKRPFARRIAVGDSARDEDAFIELRDTPTDAALPRLPLAPDDLVLGYTSGTSGRPKGAIGTHRGMIMVSGYMNPVEFGMTREDRILVTSPMAHRVGLSRVINMLCTACTIVILPRFDPKEAVDAIERENVTVISVVPTIARMILPEIEKRPQACRSLTKLLATGEAFPVELKRRLGKVLPSLGLYTMYAQTEGGLMTCLRAEEQAQRPDSVGRPVPGVEIRLVDAALEDVPIGQPGEALVRFGAPGELMTMREYFRRPDANEETLLDGGWLRTGDVLQADEGGYLYFVDRAKDMIVSGGLNIYAKEVELTLITHPAVADAAVIGVPDEMFGESVLAYIELEPGHDVDAEALVEHCRERIASYKKPRQFRFAQDLPRTTSGKVMKGTLREREAATSTPSAK